MRGPTCGIHQEGEYVEPCIWGDKYMGYVQCRHVGIRMIQVFGGWPRYAYANEVMGACVRGHRGMQGWVGVGTGVDTRVGSS